MITGKVKQIETLGSFDGPGIRIVVFLQGCPLRCIYCHNPEMWNYYEKIKEVTPENLIKNLKKYYNYFGDNGGVTFSGGEPLVQSEFLCECLKLCRDENIHTALDTSGAVYNNYTNKILDLVDLVILDLKAIDEKKYQSLTGYPIDAFNRFLELLQTKKNKIWIRTVIIPGINDNLDYISALAKYIKELDNVEKVELLPYQKLGDAKYEKLKIYNSLKGNESMNIIKCKELEEELQRLFK